jgi:phenylalanyl-tRNA synthetase beta chain
MQLRTARAKRALAARGMVEAVTWSFISKPAAELFGGGQAELALANPIASDLSDMRPSLLPGLIAASQANINRGSSDVALFEVGQVFKGDKPEDQLTAASGVRHGYASSRGKDGTGRARRWQMRSMPKPMICRAGAAGALMCAAVVSRSKWLHRAAAAPSRSVREQKAAISVSCTCARWSSLARTGPDGVEVISTAFPKPSRRPRAPNRCWSLVAPVSRDFAFIVDRKVKAGDLVRATQGVDKKLITGVSVFDLYEGKGIDPDKKSLAIAVTIQPREKTMTDQEIDAVAAKIVAEVIKKTGGTLRA